MGSGLVCPRCEVAMRVRSTRTTETDTRGPSDIAIAEILRQTYVLGAIGIHTDPLYPLVGANTAI